MVVQESAQIRRMQEVELVVLPLFGVLPARPSCQKHRVASLGSPPCQHNQLKPPLRGFHSGILKEAQRPSQKLHLETAPKLGQVAITDLKNLPCPSELAPKSLLHASSLNSSFCKAKLQDEVAGSKVHSTSQPHH